MIERAANIIGLLVYFHDTLPFLDGVCVIFPWTLVRAIGDFAVQVQHDPYLRRDPLSLATISYEHIQENSGIADVAVLP